MAENSQPQVSGTQQKLEAGAENIPVSRIQDWDTGRYEQVAEIGVGAYGVVYKAKDMMNDEGVVAMKCLRVENTEQGMPLSMVREIALLRQLETKEHPNVVKLLDICLGRKTVHETQLMLVFEHIDQDLDMYLRGLPPAGLGEDQIRNIMAQMLRGIDFLHCMRVVHRDLKPQNILITHSGKIKIADFGLARIFSMDMALTAVVVTLWYRAPEVLLQDIYAYPVDMWSVGCIFAELYNRRPLFRGTGDVNQLRKIFDLLGRPSQSDWPVDVAIPITSFPVQSAKPVSQFVPRMNEQAADLLLKLLSFNPSSRPSPKSALEHKIFQTASLPESVPSQVETDKSPASNDPNLPHRRLPYTQNLGAQNFPNDENAPLSYSCWHETEATNYKSIPSRHSSAATSGLLQSNKSDTTRPASAARGRAFGNPLPLNVTDGASGSLLVPPDPCQESGFLTPPSDIASTSSDTESSISRTSSSDEAPYSIETSLNPHSTGLTVEASVERPESVSLDSAGVVRRSRAESEGQSRMSWTCDPVDVVSTPPSSTTYTSPKDGETLSQPSTKPDTDTPPDSQNLDN